MAEEEETAVASNVQINISSAGMQNAAVFPVPFFALARISLPRFWKTRGGGLAHEKQKPQCPGAEACSSSAVTFDGATEGALLATGFNLGDAPGTEEFLAGDIGGEAAVDRLESPPPHGSPPGIGWPDLAPGTPRARASGAGWPDTRPRVP
ncbi:hypothetical protein ABZP36_018148 [Zizania latifolia]